MNLGSLMEWFKNEARELPWRENRTPYRVWISEVMLQQTQVAVVIPYFQRWMETFPSLEVLANAPVDQVIKLWEGLGYYSRARNIHFAAGQIMTLFGGEIPSCAEQLFQIKGFGPYTVGAVRSFAFGQKAAAVDGNVLRVVSRLYGIEEEIDKGATRKRVEEQVLKVLPDKESWVAMEALIELGATVCAKRPNCKVCPLKNQCKAYSEGRELELPKKGSRVKTTHLHRHVPIVVCEEKVLVQKGEKGKIFADLFHFPFFEMDEEDDIKDKLHLDLGLKCKKVGEMELKTHSFTRYKAFLYPSIWNLLELQNVEGMEWVALDSLGDIPFCSGHRELAKNLLDTILKVTN